MQSIKSKMIKKLRANGIYFGDKKYNCETQTFK